MFTWLKKLFGSDVPETPVIAQEVQKKQETPKAAVGKVTEVKSDIPAPKKAEPKKKTTATKKAEPAKRGRKKAGVTKTDLNKMNKDQLEAYAKKEFKVDLDKRRKKADLVDEVLKLASK